MDRYLPPGYLLKNPDHSGEYEIKELIGTGASCAVYYATFLDDNTPTEHLLKEYNPRRINLKRDETGSLQTCKDTDIDAFEEGLRRFQKGYEMQMNVRLCSKLKNTTSNIQTIFDANGTRYIDMTVMEGHTYDNIKETSLYDLLRRLKAITEVVGNYHSNGLLHLDIKPENIFTIPETVELVQMFDFDSVMPKSDVARSAFLSYTQSWAAQEQLLPNRRNQICEATDLFAIGEILFFKLMGRHSESHERRSFSSYQLDPGNELFRGVNPRVFVLLSEILRHTICNRCADRYQTASELLEKLTEAISLADPKKTFLQHHLPSKTAFFIGREAEMQEIDERLKNTDKLFISGMGGMGKSELVKQYAHARKNDYDAVIFAVCDNDLESMILDDSALPIGNLQYFPNEKPKEYYAKKLRELRSLCNQRVLIIVDNFNNLQDKLLDELLKLDCKMLFTTRCDVTEYNYEQIILGTMAAEEVWDIFCTWYKRPLNDEDRAFAQQIIALYQSHTMAIELIAKQMRVSNLSPKVMLEKLNTGGFSESGRERVVHAKDGTNSKLNIHAHIRRLFDVSDLREEWVYILANLSLMPPSGISRQQFHDWCKLDSYGDIEDLAESGWVRQDEEMGVISLHPVIADIMLDQLEDQLSLCKTLLNTIALFLHKDRPDADIDQISDEAPCIRYERLHPLVNSILQRLYQFNVTSTAAAQFIHTAAMHLYGFGNIDLLIRSIQKAVEQYAQMPNQNRLVTINLLNTKGALLSEICEFELSEKSYLEALDLAIEHYGPSHKQIQSMRHNLASLYLNWGQLEKVHDYYFEMSTILKSNPTKKPTASQYNGMGRIAKRLGYYKDALYFYQQALASYTDLHGPNHGLVGLANLNIGSLHLSCGIFTAAETHLKRALSIFIEYYGTNHSDTATSYSQLGTLFYHRGKYDLAEEHYQKALSIRAKLYGNASIDTANSYNDLGTLYYKTNQFDPAEKFYTKVLTIKSFLLGRNHIDLIPILNDMGNIYMARRQLDEAERYYLDAEQIIEAQYRTRNFPPELATIKNNLGMLYMNRRKYGDAIHYCSEALSLWKGIYGDNHPNIANAHINLGVLYRESTMYDESIAELKAAIRVLEKIHGPNSINLDLGSAYSALGKTYAELGRKELAETFYQKALEVRMKLLNPDHPSIQLVQQRIQELSTT